MSAAPWPVEFERRAGKDLERLDAPVRQRVITAIERLSSDPHSAGLRKLTGRTESRLRAGDWRVIVELDIAQRTIVIVRILPRAARTTAERPRSTQRHADRSAVAH